MQSPTAIMGNLSFTSQDTTPLKEEVKPHSDASIKEKFPSLLDARACDLEFAGILSKIAPPQTPALLTLSTAIKHAPVKAFSQCRKTVSALAYYRTLKSITDFSGPANIKNWGPEQKEAFIAENASYIKNALFEFVNQFSNLIGGEIGFSQEDANTVFELLKQIILNYDSVAMGRSFPAIQISPLFGAYHDRIMSNFIKRAINITLTVFELTHVRVNCTNAVKE
jgi:hypothetical protein